MKWWVLLICVCVSACQTPGYSIKVDAAHDPRQVLQHQNRLADLKNWDLKARIGIKSTRQSGSATLLWQQQADNYRLKLILPFAQGIINIERQNGLVTLVDQTGQTRSANSAAALIYQSTGWYIPVAELSEWIIGQVPSVYQTQWSTDGLVAEAAVDVWEIDYQTYQAVPYNEDFLMLPGKIVLTHPELTLRLILNQWTL